MKPKDLKSPFKWEDRRPSLHDLIFFVPEHYEAHQQELFPSFESFFGNDHPVHLEYCSGNGEWILGKAKEHPEKNWVAVELCFERVKKIYSKFKNHEVKNAMIISGEGLTFSREYLPDHSLEAVYVNFPDPWPKRRHAKHRLIQRPFVEELRRTLRKGGKAIFVTDHIPYKIQMEEAMREWEKVPSSLNQYGSSFFDRLWRSKGLEIHQLSYVQN